jgi:hypothetical protein
MSQAGPVMSIKIHYRGCKNLSKKSKNLAAAIKCRQQREKLQPQQVLSV